MGAILFVMFIAGLYYLATETEKYFKCNGYQEKKIHKDNVLFSLFLITVPIILFLMVYFGVLTND